MLHYNGVASLRRSVKRRGIGVGRVTESRIRNPTLLYSNTSRFRVGSPRDSHARRPKHIIAPTVAALHFLCNCARFKCFAFNRADGVVQLGVKSFPQAYNRTYALRFEQAQELRRSASKPSVTDAGASPIWADARSKPSRTSSSGRTISRLPLRTVFKRSRSTRRR